MDPDEPNPTSEPAEPDDERVGKIREALRAYASEFMLLMSADGELIASSETTTLGYTDEEGGRHIAEFLHPDDLPAVLEAVRESRRSGVFGRSWTARARRADGSWGLFEGTLLDARDDPDLRGSVLRVRELSDANDNDPGDPSDRFHSLSEALPLGILSADRRGWVVFCNRAAEQIFSLPSDQLTGRGWERAIMRDDRLEVVAAAGQVITLGVPQQVTFRVESGLFPRWASAKFVPLQREGQTNGWIATVEDVTDRRRAESQLAFQATHDPLTRLPNRLLLQDRLRQACARLRRGSDSVSVVFLDLDGFKEVNDTYGHHLGDQVLKEVARRLRQVVRDVDTVARLSGDEFVVVCESIPDDDLEAMVLRVRDVLSVPHLVEGIRVEIGASVGVAITRDPAVEVEQLLSVADQQMYRQKRAR